MKYGVNLWIGDTPLSSALEVISKIGFDYCEFSLDYPFPNYVNKKMVNELKKIKEHGLELGFHGPVYGILLAHPRKEISEASFRVMKKCINFASKFNPIYFNFHQITSTPTLMFNEIKKKIFNQALLTTKETVRIGKKLKIPITIENNPSPFFGTPSQFKIVFNKIKKINFCFDIGHVWECNWAIKQQDTREPINEKFEFKDWINQFKKKIFVIHLHDVFVYKNYSPRTHLTLGEGNLDLEKICKTIKRTNCKYVLIEVFQKKTYKDLKKNLEFCKSLI